MKKTNPKEKKFKKTKNSKIDKAKLIIKKSNSENPNQAQ